MTQEEGEGEAEEEGEGEAEEEGEAQEEEGECEEGEGQEGRGQQRRGGGGALFFVFQNDVLYNEVSINESLMHETLTAYCAKRSLMQWRSFMQNEVLENRSHIHTPKKNAIQDAPKCLKMTRNCVHSRAYCKCRSRLLSEGKTDVALSVF